jgi:hypothetical protein
MLGMDRAVTCRWTRGGEDPRRVGKRRVRIWRRAGARFDEVNDLLECATDELCREDIQFANALAARAENYPAHGHGLAYYVFEHNLVFPIFRSWVASKRLVLWDEKPVHRVSVRKTTTRPPEDQRKQVRDGVTITKSFVDLQVRLQERWTGAKIGRFEAKWWQESRATRYVASDADKLRRIARSHSGRGFLITFWYDVKGEGPFAANMKAAEDTASRKMKADLVFAGRFESKIYCYWCDDPRPRPGWFVMAVFEVAR